MTSLSQSIITKHPIVIGLGTGRSGSTSLAGLLSLQTDSHVTHERNEYHQTWETAQNCVTTTMIQMQKEQQQFPSRLVGDIHFAYLPYVEQIADGFPNVIFLCLYRNQQAVVESWLRKIGNRNPWLQTQDAKTKFARCPWDACFPNLNTDSPRDAATAYWKMYRTKAMTLQQKYPDQFYCIPTEELSSVEGQSRILDLIGIEPASQISFPNLQLNCSRQGRHHD